MNKNCSNNVFGLYSLIIKMNFTPKFHEVIERLE